MYLRRRRWAVAWALLLGLSLGPAAGAEAASYPSLFGTRESYSANFKLFPKWSGAIRRYLVEQQSCTSQCDKAGWKRLIDGLRGAGLRRQIERVNDEMNEHPYILDSVNWGLPDYWETPFEFLRKDGDCEDYAISKFMALKELGFRTADMRVVVLQDLNLEIGHAVLVVYLDGEALILDNQIGRVVSAGSIRHYQPLYSINEEGWWLHRP